jgi:RNA polymerase sigma factor (sigma-70 family)
LETDETLYLRVQSGDREAMTELVERYHRPLFQFIYRMTGLEQAAEDLIQETFLRIFAHKGRLPNCFHSWAFTIACNLTRDSFRRAANRREVTDPMEEGSFEVVMESAETTALRLVEGQTTAHAVLDLPLLFREVLVLRFYHELRLKEIADITGVPLGTIKSRLYRALRYLKERLVQEESLHENKQ